MSHTAKSALHLVADQVRPPQGDKVHELIAAIAEAQTTHEHVEAPPDNCPLCLERRNLPHSSQLLPSADGDSVRGDYCCRRCACEWYTSWGRGWRGLVDWYRTNGYAS